MNELALFAGAGGGILGGTLLGWRTVCAVEIESGGQTCGDWEWISSKSGCPRMGDVE